MSVRRIDRSGFIRNLLGCQFRLGARVYVHAVWPRLVPYGRASLQLLAVSRSSLLARRLEHGTYWRVCGWHWPSEMLGAIFP